MIYHVLILLRLLSYVLVENLAIIYHLLGLYNLRCIYLGICNCAVIKLLLRLVIDLLVWLDIVEGRLLYHFWLFLAKWQGWKTFNCTEIIVNFDWFHLLNWFWLSDNLLWLWHLDLLLWLNLRCIWSYFRSFIRFINVVVESGVELLRKERFVKNKWFNVCWFNLLLLLLLILSALVLRTLCLHLF